VGAGGREVAPYHHHQIPWEMGRASQSSMGATDRERKRERKKERQIVIMDGYDTHITVLSGDKHLVS